MKKRIRFFLLFLASWLIIHSTVITIDGLNNNVEKTDCILILGNQINKDGTLSDRLKSRVDKGLELYLMKFAPKIIVSGGLGKEGYYEAREMKKYLLSKGVNSNDIIVDDKALTTYQTMCNYIPTAKRHHFNSVIIVSQFYHISRSRSILHALGVSSISTEHAEYFEWRDLYSVIREFFAYYWWKVSK